MLSCQFKGDKIKLKSIKSDTIKIYIEIVNNNIIYNIYLLIKI